MARRHPGRALRDRSAGGAARSGDQHPAGRPILQGQLSYVDFFDTQPPLIQYLNVPVAWAARALQVNPIPVFTAAVTLLAAWAGWMTMRITRAMPEATLLDRLVLLSIPLGPCALNPAAGNIGQMLQTDNPVVNGHPWTGMLTPSLYAQSHGAPWAAAEERRVADETADDLERGQPAAILVERHMHGVSAGLHDAGLVSAPAAPRVDPRDVPLSRPRRRRGGLYAVRRRSSSGSRLSCAMIGRWQIRSIPASTSATCT